LTKTLHSQGGKNKKHKRGQFVFAQSVKKKNKLRRKEKFGRLRREKREGIEEMERSTNGLKAHRQGGHHLPTTDHPGGIKTGRSEESEKSSIKK